MKISPQAKQNSESPRKTGSLQEQYVSEEREGGNREQSDPMERGCNNA